jgi:hypothetical protein
MIGLSLGMEGSGKLLNNFLLCNNHVNLPHYSALCVVTGFATWLNFSERYKAQRYLNRHTSP